MSLRNHGFRAVLKGINKHGDHSRATKKKSKNVGEQPRTEDLMGKMLSEMSSKIDAVETSLTEVQKKKVKLLSA
ncbi:hypothetical protein NZNM25_08900 [Nitrosopumilus zosterae]|uniref:Uncharacterized protein n=1 Tax=Nitrosopumilus zosterae TaxID=718286 RepID=A0A2S2KR19_9ARCH|nr:hypothetical protein [Nitrosopumilus zosterae]BDQ30467.1 hypothetical protein NZOSNM25_000570 [Nitrosopumilus zosterae]GBH34099.1 hypothetical protein NZNM25_08900 [Nitrosopumilus zosterae]